MDKATPKTVIGVDIAKRVFALYWVEADGEVCRRSRMKREQFERFMRERVPATVVLEAGGGAHHWGRWLGALGHEVRLLPPQYVRPFVPRNATDATDARGIWEAARSPSIRPVPVKSEASQAVCALHRMRSQLLDMRRMQSNQLKALLYEFGIVAVPRAKVTSTQIEQWAAEGRLPTLLVPHCLRQIERIAELAGEEAELSEAIGQVLAQDPLGRRLDAMPGVGPLGASALSAQLAEAADSYRGGRHFAAAIGLPPRMSGTGGKVHIGKMSKRGDPYLRGLLINGARAVLAHGQRNNTLSPWLAALLQRRPFNVVVVALANKMARTAWALAAHGREYRKDWSPAAA